MKAADIVYGTSYAIGSPEYPWTWRRGTVTALPRSGKVQVTWANNGATVECPTRKVNKPWDEHEAEQVEARRREQERRAGLERSALAANEAAAWLLQHVDPKVLPYHATKTDAQPHSDFSGITGGTGNVSTVQLKRIVESALALASNQEA